MKVSGKRELSTVSTSPITTSNCQYRNVRTTFILIILLFIYSSSAFSQDGYATYYTSRSCKKEGTSGIWTASRERYKESAFTCARPYDRFGSKFRVTRVSTGKSVVVRCNDRGPGRGPRSRGVVIDLTPAAFKRLAPLEKGRIQVHVTDIK
jgi:rare lipoprotein A